jgi:hypothetical protein
MLSLFPGAGMIYAEQTELGIVYYALEFTALHAITKSHGTDKRVAWTVFALIKAAEIGMTVGMVYNHNVRMNLSSHPMDSSPRITLSLSLR